MIKDQQDYYNIPIAYRKMENLHIVFWIFKDIGWCMGFAWLGISMIVPTLIISSVIAWRTRQIVSELCHIISGINQDIKGSYKIYKYFFNL